MSASIGYRIVLPPGWARIPLLSGTDAAIEAILDAAGAEPSPRRDEAAIALRKAASEAREIAGVDLYLPVVARYGEPIAASFVVADVSFGSLDPRDPAPLVASLAKGGRRLMIDGGVCARSETTRAADPARGVPVQPQRVDYVLPVPDDPDRWVVVTFSALRPGPEPARLFDAIMGTFRWNGVSTTSV